MDKVTGQCPQTTTFLKRKESRSGIEPRSYQPNAIPLGQTGSHFFLLFLLFCFDLFYLLDSRCFQRERNFTAITLLSRDADAGADNSKDNVVVVVVVIEKAFHT